jgi:hypothetical protein
MKSLNQGLGSSSVGPSYMLHSTLHTRVALRSARGSASLTSTVLTQPGNHHFPAPLIEQTIQEPDSHTIITHKLTRHVSYKVYPTEVC